jgi:hypothetical protein
VSIHLTDRDTFSKYETFLNPREEQKEINERCSRNRKVGGGYKEGKKSKEKGRMRR